MSSHREQASSRQTIVETTRMRLLPIREEHFEALYAVWSEPEVAEYLISRPQSRADFARMFRTMLELGRELDMWAVVERGSDRVIGRCGFYAYGPSRTPELAFLLSAGSWGAGLATEMTRAALDHAFRVRGWPRVVALIVQANHRAQRVLAKLGMDRVGSVETHVPGLRADLYELLRRATCCGSTPSHRHEG